MAEVLIDSSSWIAYFRGQDRALGETIDHLLDDQRAALCGIVELELLSGVRAHEREELGELLQALTYIDTARADFILAGEKLGELRRRGVTIPASDSLIAAICLRRDLQLLTADSHFDHLPEVRRFRVAG